MWSCLPARRLARRPASRSTAWGSWPPYLSMNTPFAPSSRNTFCEPSTHFDVEDARRVRVHAGGRADAAEDLARRPTRTFATAVTPRHLRRRVRGRDGDRREVVLRRDRVVGVPDVVDGAAEALRDPGREHRDERHQRQADHQRGRRRGRALGVAAASCRARARPRRRRTARAGQPSTAASGGTSFVREQRDAREDQQGADAHPEEDPGRAEARAEEAEDERREAERSSSRARPIGR